MDAYLHIDHKTHQPYFSFPCYLDSYDSDFETDLVRMLHDKIKAGEILQKFNITKVKSLDQKSDKFIIAFSYDKNTVYDSALSKYPTIKLVPTSNIAQSGIFSLAIIFQSEPFDFNQTVISYLQENISQKDFTVELKDFHDKKNKRVDIIFKIKE